MAELVKTSDLFVNSVEHIGRHFKIPYFILGVTLVCFGSSLPEVSASIYASMTGDPELTFGSAVGSNLTNILLLLGVAVIVAKGLSVKYELLYIDLPIIHRFDISSGLVRTRGCR